MIDQVSVVIVTKNEEHNIAACIQSLSDFPDIWVVDSHSTDHTVPIANQYGVFVFNFDWNGQYPKKRQWCLDNLNLKDWVLFIDADERMTPALAAEIASLSWDNAGYFIKGRYVLDGKILNHGMANNKLCLIHRHKAVFPVVNDLDIETMGEIEGHYQPVLLDGKAGSLKNALVHHACDDPARWDERHLRYAHWQAVMNRRRAHPLDQRFTKRLWHVMPLKPFIAFLHSYGVKRGFMDGRLGYRHAVMRARYYAMIAHASKILGTSF